MSTDKDQIEDQIIITIDQGEVRSQLPQHVGRLWPSSRVARLPVGDVEIGADVLVERKTVQDFIASLDDGRLFRQARDMTRVAVRPLMIVEGEDTIAAAGIEPSALRGVLIALTVGFRMPVLRTGSIEETATYLVQIARRETRRRRRYQRSDRRDTRKARAALDVLTAIPGVGDHRARALVQAFGSLEGVLLAEEDELARVDGMGDVTAGRVRAAVTAKTAE